MPALDMPLEQLREYRGCNPKPADFDEYWADALAEMRGTDPDVSLSASAEFSARNAECLDMYFTGVGGARVYCKLLRPRGAKNTPVIFMFHGYGGNSCEWCSKLNYINEGYTVCALDARGQAGKSDDIYPAHGTTFNGHIVRGLSDPDPKALGFRRIFLDTAQMVYITCGLDFVDPSRLACTGTSQGGALTLACAALVPEIKRCVPVVPFLCDYKRVWQMDLDKAAYAELRWWFRNYDPFHLREEEVFTKLGYIDCVHLSQRIKAKTLMVSALLDDICPPSTQFAAYNGMTCEKEMLLLPDFGHEDNPESRDKAFMFLTGV